MEKTKNIFHVNSFISYISCIGIIKHKKLSKEECVFLLDSRFQYIPPYPTFRLDQNMSFFSHWRNPFLLMSNKKLIGEVDSFILKNTDGKKFNLYTYGLKQPIALFIGTHPSCLSISVFEEGLAAYRLDFLKSPIRKHSKLGNVWLNIFFSGRELRGAQYFYDPQKYSSAYTLTEGSMKPLPRKIQLNFQRIVTNLHIATKFKPKPCSAIFPLGPLKECDSMNLDAVTQAIKFVLLRNYPVYIKLHPVNQNKKVYWENRIKVSLEMNRAGKIFFISEKIPLEIIAARRRDLIFCVANSSVGIYASQLGLSVYSYNYYSLKKDFLLDILRIKPLFDIQDYQDNIARNY